LGVNGPRYDGPVRAEKVSRGFAAAAAVLVALAIGLYLGGHPTKLPGFMRDVFVEESASLQAEATQTIEDNFIQKVPDEQLRNASVQGMVRSLHSRFSHYFTPAQNKLFEQSTSGEFSGVGMTVVERKKGLEVAGVFKDSPAKRAGIKTGDLIIAVNGRSIAGESSDVSTARIKGKPGTFVRLTIETPGGKQRTIRVQRQTIKVPVVQGKLDDVSRRSWESWGCRRSPRAHTASSAPSCATSRSAAPTGSCSISGPTGAGCWTRRCWSRACSSPTE